MKITQDIRDYVAANEASDGEDAIQAGLEEKSREFRESGSEIYVQVDGD